MSGFGKGDLRLYQERKDKSIVVVFTNLRNGSGNYDAIGNAMEGERPTLCGTGVSPEWLYSKCRPVQWSELTPEWKAAITEYMTRGGDPFDPEAEPGFWRKAPKLPWKFHKGKPGIQANLSSSGPYVISHRPEEFTLSYRPEGEHHNVGTFKDLKLAKAAAERHAALVELNMRDDWEGSGAKRKRKSFLAYLKNMAADPRGVLQSGAKALLELHKVRPLHA
jgi:hypothetical protein